MQLVWRTPSVDTLKLGNYTRIENVHKVRKKTSVFYYVAVVCTNTGRADKDARAAVKQLRAMETYKKQKNRYQLCFFRCGQSAWTVNLMEKLEMMHKIQEQVCGFISAHSAWPHQKTKRETSDASKTQLDQESWNRTVLKFDSENQLNVQNYIFQCFSAFFPWSHGMEKITSLSVWLGVRRTPRI